MADEILSKSEFAVRRSVRPAAVSNWIVRGQLTAPAVRSDGKIDVALAEAQLAAREPHGNRGGSPLTKAIGAYVGAADLPTLSQLLKLDRGQSAMLTRWLTERARRAA
jgi:hypothetical protein